MYSKKVLSLFVSLLFFTTTYSQYLEVGTTLGAATYQGDISPFQWKVSFQGGKFAKGLIVGYNINEIFSIKASYYSTSIAASDANAKDNWRKERNLSFRSSLSEIALHLDIEPMDFFNNKYRLKPQIHVGLGVFKFNPQAKLNDQWYDLQPLSTEGQGLPNSSSKPYYLTQLVIPFGIGLRYYATDDLSFEFSINPRKTFTDYLDDVSTNYYDRDLLHKYKGPIAVELAFRGDESNPDDTYPQKGIGRGNNNEKDWYILNTFTVTYRFDTFWPFHTKRRVNCPSY